MKILGNKSMTMVIASGIYVLRVEGFQDDRFRLMFVCRDSHGKDVKLLPLQFRKGTKTLDLDKDVWPLVEDLFKKALSPPTPLVINPNIC